VDTREKHNKDYTSAIIAKVSIFGPFSINSVRGWSTAATTSSTWNQANEAWSGSTAGSSEIVRLIQKGYQHRSELKCCITRNNDLEK